MKTYTPTFPKIRHHPIGHPGHGDFKKVLCVCAAGIARSTTMAWTLGQAPYNFNTRAAGMDVDIALVPVDATLVRWADEIVVAEQWMHDELRHLYKQMVPDIYILRIPDEFKFRDPRLIQLIRERYNQLRSPEPQLSLVA